MYRLLFDLGLRRLEPERAHSLAVTGLRATRSTRVGRAVVQRLAGEPDACLLTHAFGLAFPSPLGVSAGLDKEATWFDDLIALGFGFVEIGTVTALAQAGNPAPRVVRLAPERALVNKMGFPNPGAAAIASRLAGRGRRSGVVGVNIGKSRTVTVDEARDDHRAAVRLLAPHADYVVVNVSSPNTPGLRDMQAEVLLRPLLEAIRDELAHLERHVPLLVKIAPDLDDGQIEAVARLALELSLDGIVAVNTTIDRGGLSSASRAAIPFDGGGVSGRPLRARAVEVLRQLRAIVGDRLVLVSVGGVESAGDVWGRILAGATLVQAYTAFVYEGPGWPQRINDELARMVADAGAASIEELVGRAAAPVERMG